MTGVVSTRERLIEAFVTIVTDEGQTFSEAEAAALAKSLMLRGAVEDRTEVEAAALEAAAAEFDDRGPVGPTVAGSLRRRAAAIREGR